MENENGVRFTKLKLVFKKAIQEILNQEENIHKLLLEPKQTDSFFNSDTSKSAIVGSEKSSIIKQNFQVLKTKLSELFKRKTKEYDLEKKLDRLDYLIKDNISGNKDITDSKYINEIMESYVVEDKIDLYNFINQSIQENICRNLELDEELRYLEAKVSELEMINTANENRINNVIKEMSNALNM